VKTAFWIAVGMAGPLIANEVGGFVYAAMFAGAEWMFVHELRRVCRLFDEEDEEDEDT